MESHFPINSKKQSHPMKLPQSTRSFRSTLALAAGGLLALAASSQAAVLYSFDGATTSTATNFSVIRSGSTINGSIGSNDGEFGTEPLTGAATTANGLLMNTGNPIVTITLTNNTGSSYALDTMHFDFLARTNGPRDLIVEFVRGATTTTIINLLDQPTFNQNLSDWQDYDVTLSTPLPSTTIADGETVSFRFTVSDFTGSGTSGSGLDNIAIQGVAIPEPSSALLSGLCVLAFLRRRR